MNVLWMEAIVRKLLKTPPTERQAIKGRYNLGNDIPLSTDELQEILQRPREMWKTAKSALTKVSNGVTKWWLNTRYQGHTSNNGVIKCTCDGTTTLN